MQRLWDWNYYLDSLFLQDDIFGQFYHKFYQCAPTEIEQQLMNQTNTEELHFSIGSGGQKNSLENKDFEGKFIHPKYYKHFNKSFIFAVLEQIEPLSGQC